MQNFLHRPQPAAWLTAALLLAAAPAALAQGVRIGATGTPDAKAVLDLSATDRGLLIPRLTAAQRTAITSPPQGLMVYQTDGTASGGSQSGFWYYAGTPAAWVYLSPATATTVAAGPGLSASTSGSTTTLSLGGTALTADTNLPLGANDLTFSGTGNVGIGGTTANLPLTVQGNSTNDAVQLRNSGGTNRWHLGLTTSGSSNGLNFAESGVADFRLFLQPGGNVGIGTSNPTRSLDVVGNVRVRGLNTAGVVMNDANGVLSTEANQTLSLTGQTLSISGTGGNSVTLPSGGSPSGAAGGALSGTYPNPGLADNAVTNAKVADDAIGIAELSASGTPSSSTYLRGDNTWATIPSSSGWSLTGNATNGNEFLGTTNDQDLIFKRNGFEAFRVFGNGRVNLGNSTPSSNSVLLGFNAGTGVTTAQKNVFIGSRAGEDNNNDGNTLIGYGAGQKSTDGGNTFVGNSAGNGVTGGSNNTFLGSSAGPQGPTLRAIGNSNVVIGVASGTGLNNSNSNNILIGASTQASAGVYDGYAIGANTTVTQSQSLVIGNVAGTNDAIRVGIGVQAPHSSLQVNGTFAVGVQTGYGGGGGPLGSANGLDQGTPNTTDKGAGYYGLAPTSTSNQHYFLPAASDYKGRIYYLRNASGSVTAKLSSNSTIIDGTNSISSGNTFDMLTSGSSKIVTAISDGSNWIIIRSGI